jgi:hypothetical protein
LLRAQARSGDEASRDFEDFLAALPADLRAEAVQQHKRAMAAEHRQKALAKEVRVHSGFG